MGSKLMSDKIAIYCSADNNYVKPAIITLKSFERFFPNLDYFIITDREEISKENQALLEDFNISILH